MPRRAKRKGSTNATLLQGEQQQQRQQQMQQKKPQQPMQQQMQPQKQQQQMQPQMQMQQQLTQPNGIQYAFQKMFLNTSQRCFLNGNGNRQSGGLESPYIQKNDKKQQQQQQQHQKQHQHQQQQQQHQRNYRGNFNPIVSKPNHFQSSRPLKDKTHELLNQTASSCDGWMVQKSKTSASRIRSEPVKPVKTISPLARNRFYELRDKTPVRHGHGKKQGGKESGNAKQRIDGGWNQMQPNDVPLPKPITPEHPGKFANKNQTRQIDTYLNIDGSRGYITNWRVPNENLHFPEPPPCGPENPPPSNRRMEDPHQHRNRPPIFIRDEKIAPLHNLATPVRDLWVTKPEHSKFGQFRCVRILPQHHECAGLERNITPNDCDTKIIANKLEKHRRPTEPGARPGQCICFRKTRRAFCTVCKATIIGRAFRKCRMHPDVGFLTDHFYCPFCRAEPAALKDL